MTSTSGRGCSCARSKSRIRPSASSISAAAYGVLGIALAHRFPEAAVVLADSDLLAVRYAGANAVLNGTRNAEAVGSVALEAVSPGQFDLIVSNVPAKVGDRAIEEDFVLAPRTRLAPGGAYWFVVVSGLNQLTKRIASAERTPPPAGAQAIGPHRVPPAGRQRDVASDAPSQSLRGPSETRDPASLGTRFATEPSGGQSSGSSGSGRRRRPLTRGLRRHVLPVARERGLSAQATLPPFLSI